jgi:hypothetical protein
VVLVSPRTNNVRHDGEVEAPASLATPTSSSSVLVSRVPGCRCSAATRAPGGAVNCATARPSLLDHGSSTMTARSSVTGLSQTSPGSMGRVSAGATRLGCYIDFHATPSHRAAADATGSQGRVAERAARLGSRASHGSHLQRDDLHQERTDVIEDLKVRRAAVLAAAAQGDGRVARRLLHDGAER